MADREITVGINLITPTVPRFLKIVEGGDFSIEAITDEGLRRIGHTWTEDLIKEAQRMRAERASALNYKAKAVEP